MSILCVLAAPRPPQTQKSYILKNLELWQQSPNLMEKHPSLVSLGPAWSLNCDLPLTGGTIPGRVCPGQKRNLGAGREAGDGQLRAHSKTQPVVGSSPGSAVLTQPGMK